MKLEDMAIRPDPLLLQARRIRLAHVGKVALEPVYVFGPGTFCRGERYTAMRRRIKMQSTYAANAPHSANAATKRERRTGKASNIKCRLSPRASIIKRLYMFLGSAPQVRFVW